MRRFVPIIFAALVVSTIAFAQTFLGHDGPYQIGYAANLNIGDSVVNLSNDGANGGFAGARGDVGNICVNVYTFDPQEEEIACCSCLVTPDGLNSLSVKDDLISNPLTPAVPNSVVIKLLASQPGADPSFNLTLCDPTKAGVFLVPGILEYGMIAWGSTLEPAAGGNYNAINAPFVQGTLTSGRVCTPTGPGSCTISGTAPVPGDEIYALTSTCAFIQADGSGFGICKSCRTGALSGSKK